MTTYIKWTKDEVDLLKELYPRIRVKNLIEKFPNRTKDTLVAKALNLGLPSAKLWQSKENRILRECFSIYSKEDLLVLIPNRSWSAIIAQGERLSLKRITNIPRRQVNEQYFKIWSANMAYILGFILADGCIIRGTYNGYSDSLKLGVQLKDMNILEKIKKELNSDHKISFNKNAAHFCVSSRKIVDDLKALGIDYNKSLNEKVTSIPEEYKKDFIRGIVDGDGTMGIDRKGYPVVALCGGKTVLTFVRDYFLSKIGVYSKIGKRTYSEKCSNFLYAIGYKSNTAIKVLKHIYDSKDNMHLERKYRIAIQCMAIQIKERKNINRKDKDD